MVLDGNKSLIVFFTCILFFLVSTNMAYTFEPIKPNTDLMLSSSKEANINTIKQLPIEECYSHIKNIILLHDNDFTNKAVYECFKNRKEQVIYYALDKLNDPIYIYEGETSIPNLDHDVAKRIFSIFPDESITPILGSYESSNFTTRVNILKAIGDIEDNSSRTIERFLIAALEDKTECAEEKTEIIGDPMRICDYAYNQLVYRYRIKKVLRSIGNSHSLETREYHIEELKNRL